jgi:hypothetical protein
MLVLGLAVLAALAVPALGLGGGDGRKVLDANVLAPVTEPYTGAATIRGVTGGGLPWILESGNADLRADGRLHVSVQGLLLARRAPVPANLQGKMPFTQLDRVRDFPDGSVVRDQRSLTVYEFGSRRAPERRLPSRAPRGERGA